MSLTVTEIKKIAHLARLNLSESEAALYTEQLCNILKFAEQMQQIDTSAINILTNTLEQSQRLRPDVVTEPNQRSAFQAIAPRVEAGLYLVPQVIDAE